MHIHIHVHIHISIYITIYIHIHIIYIYNIDRNIVHMDIMDLIHGDLSLHDTRDIGLRC